MLFEEACIKWKALPAADKTTNRQCRAFFSKKYNVYHTSQNSLALAGVANSVQQVQELEQATHNGFRAIGERHEEQSAVNNRQEAINASVMQMIAARGSDGASPTSTGGGTGGGRGGRGRGRGGAGRGGGRGNGNNGGSGRGSNRSRADGPANMTKNSKYWTAETYCWSCGYDCSINHYSGNCTQKAVGHQDAATGDNPMGGSTKDKQFSKWA